MNTIELVVDIRPGKTQARTWTHDLYDTEKWGLQKVSSDEKQPFFGYLLPIWIT